MKNYKKIMKKKLYFSSLGCTRNQVDSEVMIAKLLENDLVLSNDIEKADFFIVNTCGFLQESRDEAYGILDEIFAQKKKNARVIITGCMANLFSKEIEERYDQIYSIISSGNIDKIVEAVNKETILKDKLSYLQENDFNRILVNPKHLAFVKISEGCSKACSFCIIPKIKGPLQSRSIESVLQEINLLLDDGVFEINLIAQDLLDYGKDRNEKNSFITLLKEILKIKKDFWLRLLYVYPDEITDEFIDLFASDKRICKYLDIPLQHVSDEILIKMRRKTSNKKILELFEKLKTRIPDISIRTSLMVGFPAETQINFDELEDFIEKNTVDHLAVFKYSNEQHAHSFEFSNQISEDIKQKRFEILTKKQLDQVQKRNKKLVNRIFNVIIDGYHPQSKLLALGRTQGQAFGVDSNIIINDLEKVTEFGKIYKVKISEISGYDLIGAPI
ncbi:MAG: 30S ribosomal protein S12 methylthiotransferase RimO [Parachlamydiales bacterium]|jgi:ribosomal protein S12 methylthiotransferase